MIYKFLLEPLPYPYNALEPYMDEKTLRLHHDGHHQAYAEKLNAAIENYDALHEMTVEDILSDIELLPEAIRTVVCNNGGGYYNHAFFWPLLKKDTVPGPIITEALSEAFGDFDSFKEEFIKSANEVFGSGWTWLVFSAGKLEIINTSNQDCPLSQDKIPILAIDLWEHAYYLKHNNRRAEYIETFFRIINWEQVENNFLHARGEVAEP